MTKSSSQYNSATSSIERRLLNRMLAVEPKSRYDLQTVLHDQLDRMCGYGALKKYKVLSYVYRKRPEPQVMIYNVFRALLGLGPLWTYNVEVVVDLWFSWGRNEKCTLSFKLGAKQ